MSIFDNALSRASNLVFHGNYIPNDYYVFDERRLIYISIPKVACTSIKTALFKGIISPDSTHNGEMSIHHNSSIYEHHHLKSRQKNYYKFAFVRNPFDRLVSCYEDKVRKPIQHNGRYHFATKYNEVLIYRLFGSKFHPEMSFKDFVKLVARIPDRLADGHFKSQHAMLYEKGRLIPDYVGRFESLATDWTPIAERFGFDRLPDTNKGQRDLWLSYYDEETMQLAMNRFRDDVIQFNYQLDNPQA